MKKIFILLYAISFSITVNSQTFDLQVVNNNKFAIEFSKLIMTSKSNIFYSPFSLLSAMAMTYEGAKTETQNEFSNVLYFPKDKAEFHTNFKDIISRVEKSNTEKDYVLKIANSLWLQKDFVFLDTFTQVCKNNYGTPLNYVDFAQGDNREKARKDINKWVENQTNKKITELVNQDALDSDTRLVLTNAIYFKALWLKEFEKKNNEKLTFYGATDTVTTDFMCTSLRCKYSEDSLFSVFAIPYKDNKASMIIFLPKGKQSIENLTNTLTIELYNKVIKNLVYSNISIKFPKFKTESSIEVSGVFKNNGMFKTFSDMADFSGMTGMKNLKIDKILHKTFVDVTEQGTEAAGASAVIMSRITSVGPTKIEPIIVNKPFLYFIVESSTESILFVGKTSNITLKTTK